MSMVVLQNIYENICERIEDKVILNLRIPQVISPKHRNKGH